MNSKIQLLFVVAVSWQILNLVLVTAAPSTNSVPGGGGLPKKLGSGNRPMDLDFLGKVDNKFYFADAGVRLSWKEASEYCQSNGLKLASIESSEEWYFLMDALEKYPADGFFWTSSRESRQPSAFVWDDNEKSMNMSVIFRWVDWAKGYDYYNCAALFAYHPDSVYDPGMQQGLCEWNYFALCQTSPN